MQNCPWSGYQPATMTFCEHQLCAWIQTPANTWSNLAYVLVGCWILVRSRQEGYSQLGVIGVIAVLVGIGSFLFHATGTFWGEVLDIGAMFFFASYVLVFNVWRLWPQSKPWLVLVWFVLSALAILGLLLHNNFGILIFSAIIALAVLAEARLFRRYAEPVSRVPLWWLVAFFAAAFFVWILDITGVWCDPHNHWLQGHALWHVLNSCCFVFLYHFQKQFFKTSA